MLITILLTFINIWSYFLSPYNFINSTEIASKSVSIEKFCDRKKINSPLYYTDSKGFPFVSEDEKLKLVGLARKTQSNSNETINKNINAISVLYLLPRLRGIVDTVKYDYLLNNKQENLDWHIQYVSTYYDAVIIGTVIDINYKEAYNKCLYFKTTYIIKIEKILNKHSEININDTVELKHFAGYTGNCDLKNIDLISIMPGIKEYKIGDRNIFLLSHNDYYTQFIKNKYDLSKNYEDVYCPNAFLLSLENEFFDISNLNVLEKFLKN